MFRLIIFILLSVLSAFAFSGERIDMGSCTLTLPAEYKKAGENEQWVTYHTEDHWESITFRSPKALPKLPTLSAVNEKSIGVLKVVEYSYVDDEIEERFVIITSEDAQLTMEGAQSFEYAVELSSQCELKSSAK